MRLAAPQAALSTSHKAQSVGMVGLATTIVIPDFLPGPAELVETHRASWSDRTPTAPRFITSAPWQPAAMAEGELVALMERQQQALLRQVRWLLPTLRQILKLSVERVVTSSDRLGVVVTQPQQRMRRRPQALPLL